MFSTIKSATISGIHAYQIDVEIDSKRGLPMEHIVGLPDTVIKESKARIKTAIKNSGFDYNIRQYTINLAPADLPKEGVYFDLAIAVGLLICNDQITVPTDTFFIGELSLNGDIKPVKGILSICEMVAKSTIKRIVVPYENRNEAALIKDITIIPIKKLIQLVSLDYLTSYTSSTPLNLKPTQSPQDFQDVKGQHVAKRALEIVAAGYHNILLVGPPGSGKSMLLQRLNTIMPPLTYNQAIETIKIKSITTATHSLTPSTQRPFRSPHHTISYAGLVGGGKKPLPGEISLAHNGILFLDELPEFNRQSLEVLRQPLENGNVTITRANQSITYPAQFLLVAAMNPCPCGYATDTAVECSCSIHERKRYIKKLSGPLLDRFDIIIEIPRLKKQEYSASTTTSETSKTIAKRVKAAIKQQHQRYQTTQQNGIIAAHLLQKNIQLSSTQKDLLGHLIETGKLTNRSCDKTIKVAQTIADLQQAPTITDQHLGEALHYRQSLSYLT